MKKQLALKSIIPPPLPHPHHVLRFPFWKFFLYLEGRQIFANEVGKLKGGQLYGNKQYVGVPTLHFQ